MSWLDEAILTFSATCYDLYSCEAFASVGSLIVEDHADTREMYALRLSSEGINVVEAQDVEQALRKATTFLPDIIATDLGLTDGSGLNLCRRLKDQDSTKGIPVIAVTGRATHEDMQSALVAGCVAVLVKPCQPDTLLAEIRRVLKSR